MSLGSVVQYSLQVASTAILFSQNCSRFNLGRANFQTFLGACPQALKHKIAMGRTDSGKSAAGEILLAMHPIAI